MGTMSQNGKLVADRKITVLWGLMTGLIAVALLLSGGEEALDNLQTVTILAASPFVILILFLCLALYKGLSQDPMFLDEKQKRAFALRLARERRHQETAEARQSREKRKREKQEPRKPTK